MENIGIIGFGFIGKALAHGFSLHANIKIYDKYDNQYDTLEDTVNSSDFIFIGVPTPMNDDGSQDLSNIGDAVDNVVRVATSRKIIILKSTIVPGTTRQYSRRYKNHDFVFNPEFLTERSAKLDFINSARIILGGRKKVTTMVEKMYRTRFTHTPIYKTTWEGAEVVKYMANSFFTVKISFLNEIYDIAKYIGVPYEDLRDMWLADQRIGNSHSDVPGYDNFRGYGGKCVLPSAEIKSSVGTVITMERLYNLKKRGTKVLIESCLADLRKINYKKVKSVNRRFVDEELYKFETDNGNFVCTEDELLPIIKNGKIVVVYAKDVNSSDLLITKGVVKCGICERVFSSLRSLSVHIRKCHRISSKEYYDKYMRKNKEGICAHPDCSNPTYFNGIGKGYAKCCSHRCSNNLPELLERNRKHTKLLWENEEYRNKVLIGVQKAYDNDPNIGIRRSITMKKNKRNVGGKNGMKRIEARKKVSEFKKELLKDPNERRKLALQSSKAWKNGKFEGVKVGRCKWYSYKHSNGNLYKVQGTWELSFIKWLDEQDLSFKCHKGRISYILGGLKRSYYPDFWIDAWNCFVDVKCKYRFNKEKHEAIINSNPNLELKLLFKEDLKQLGVNIK